jgi:hypothetical protein
MPRPPERGAEITDEHVALWREGCALLAAMSPREYRCGESERYRAFQRVNKNLTWELVGPHSESLFSAHLNGSPDPWVSPEYRQYIDWPVAQTWRRSLIDATGITPRNFR